MKYFSMWKNRPNKTKIHKILQNTQSTLDYTKGAATAATFLVILSQIFLSLDLNINKLSKNEM